MKLMDKINKYLNESDDVNDIMSKNSVIVIKGSIPIATSSITLDTEKKFFNAKSFKKDSTHYVVDYQTFEKISKFDKSVLKKWHKDNNITYYGK